jgi:death-on-curing protein
MVYYFDIEYAIKVHDDIMNVSGGLLGIMKEGQLHSILDFVQSDDYYPTFEDKICYLFYSINKGHCFNDGNKRASVALSAFFLEINSMEFFVDRFIEKMENIAVDVADNRIDRELLLEIITSVLCEDDYSEELKLKIALAKGL